MEAGILCTIDGETFHSIAKNTWIDNSGASCHITNNNTGLYDITEINKLVQGILGIISATIKGKLCMKVCPVDGSENVYSLIFELLQGEKVKSDHKNKIFVQSSNGYIILDCCIKTHDG